MRGFLLVVSTLTLVLAQCDESNWQEQAPDLEGCNLSGADLIGADLSYAILDNADLSYANLSNANFYSASLVNADLSNAVSWNTNFDSAFLCGADISGLDYVGTPITDFDCFDVCGGSGVLDECGVCDGDGTACFGCMDPFATNYSELAIYDDGSCEYFNAGVSNDPPSNISTSYFYDVESVYQDESVVDYNINFEDEPRRKCVESLNGNGSVVCANQLYVKGNYIDGADCNQWEFTMAIYELDIDGNLLWYDETGRFDDSGNIDCTSYSYTNGLVKGDNGYYVFGSTSSGDNVAYIIKYDLEGNQIWVEMLNYTGEYNRDDYVYDGLLSSNGNLVFVGSSQLSNGSSEAVMWILDSDGQIINYFGYDEYDDQDQLYGVIETQDGNYAAVGRTYDSPFWHPLLIKFNEDGIIYSSVVSSEQNSFLNNIKEFPSLVEFNNGNLLYFGQNSSHYASFIMFSTDGEYLSYASDHDGFEISDGQSKFLDGIQTIDNKIILTGWAYNSFNAKDFCTVKLDQNMNFEWVHYHGEVFSGNDMAYSVFQMEYDNTLIISGIGYVTHQPNWCPIILKVNFQDGCMNSLGCNYNPYASNDDGSCYFEDVCGVCEGNDYDFCDDDGDGTNNYDQWGYGVYNLTAADVPSDQGGRVFMNFDRSFYDTDTLQSRSETYTIELMDNDQWYVAQSFGAYGADSYNVIVPTLYDNQETTFRVIANMDEGNFVSMDYVVASSLDNLAPAVPTNLSGEFSEGEVSLAWSGPEDDDFAYFKVYREELLHATTIESEFVDIELPNVAELVYQISSVDHSGNESASSEGLGVLVCLSGDINEDYEVNVIDVVLLVEHILDINPYESENCSIDQNGDGIVDVLDVVLLVNIILDVNGGEE